jgi:hypothetical protein
MKSLITVLVCSVLLAPSSLAIPTVDHVEIENILKQRQRNLQDDTPLNEEERASLKRMLSTKTLRVNDDVSNNQQSNHRRLADNKFANNPLAIAMRESAHAKVKNIRRAGRRELRGDKVVGDNGEKSDKESKEATDKESKETRVGNKPTKPDPSTVKLPPPQPMTMKPPAAADKADKPAKPAKPAKPVKPVKPDKPDKPDKPFNKVKAARAAKPKPDLSADKHPPPTIGGRMDVGDESSSETLSTTRSGGYGGGYGGYGGGYDKRQPAPSYDDKYYEEE